MSLTTDDPANNPDDQLSKIRMLINASNSLSQKLFVPSKFLALDERMMLWRHKYGIKFYELTTNDSYMLNAILAKATTTTRS